MIFAKNSTRFFRARRELFPCMIIKLENIPIVDSQQVPFQNNYAVSCNRASHIVRVLPHHRTRRTLAFLALLLGIERTLARARGFL